MTAILITYGIAALLVFGAILATRDRGRKIRLYRDMCERCGLILVDYYDHKGTVSIVVADDQRMPLPFPIKILRLEALLIMARHQGRLMSRVES